MTQQRKVIHVELITPPDGLCKHYYFGSVAAIYEILTREIIGVSKETLWNVLQSGEYRNKKAIIRQGTIISKQTQRGKRREAG